MSKPFKNSLSLKLLAVVLIILIQSILVMIQGNYTVFELFIVVISTSVIGLMVHWLGSRWQWNDTIQAIVIVSITLVVFIPFLLMQKNNSTETEPVQNIETESQNNLETNGNSSYDSYDKAVLSFKKMSDDQLKNQLESGSSFYLYIGSKECPYCVEFAPLLSSAVEQLSISVFYLDVSEFSPMMGDLLNQLEIHTIPQLIQIEDGSVAKQFQPKEEYSVEEISRFLEAN